MRAKELILQVVNEGRPDSRDRLDTADAWLSQFTYENFDKHPNDRVVQTLLKRYPLDQEMEVYRGMNFSKKEDYDRFIQGLEQNQGFQTNCMTSWAPSRDVAEHFAIVRPTYNITWDKQGFMDWSEMSRSGEYVAGYRGVILKTLVHVGQGIDARKSKVAHEPEIVLLPGLYQVKVEEVKKFQHVIDDGADIERIVLSAKREEILHSKTYAAKFVDFVVKNHKDKLTDRAKEHLFNAYRPTTHGSFHMRLDEPAGWRDNDTWTVRIHVINEFFYMAANGYFTPGHTRVARKLARMVMQKVIQAYRDHAEFKNMEVPEMEYILKLAPELEGEFRDAQRQTIGKRYNRLNSDDVKHINSLNGRERENAMRKHIDQLVSTLKGIR